MAEKFPAIELKVALEICHWKLLQEPAEGSAIDSDVHVPSSEPDPGAGAGAGPGADGAPGAVGSRRSDLPSKPHAVEKVEAAASVASSKRVRFMFRFQLGWEAELQPAVRTHGIVSAAPGNFIARPLESYTTALKDKPSKEPPSSLMIVAFICGDGGKALAGGAGYPG